MKLLPLATSEILDLVAGWLAQKENYQWLDFGERKADRHSRAAQDHGAPGNACSEGIYVGSGPTHAVCGTINGEAFMEGKTAALVLPNLPAHVECQVEQIVDTHGDHAVVILRAMEAECQERVRPLTMAATPWNYGG